MICDTVIIGGGVVGLSILRQTTLSGYNAVLLERNPHILDGASGRNSGILCTGVDAPVGSLERALIRDSISNIRLFCKEMNVPMRECGSLVCVWPWDEEDSNLDEEKKIDPIANKSDLGNEGSCHQKLLEVLRESHDAGDTNASYLNSKRVSELESSLSSECRGAVHIPGEIVVDPWLLPLAYAVQSRQLAKQSALSTKEVSDVIQTSRDVLMDQSVFDAETGLWNIATRSTSDKMEEIMTIKTRSVINAAGINCDKVQALAAAACDNKPVPPPDFEARPRRGQYIVYSAPWCETSEPNDFIPTRPIQPVPTDRTKGIFVYSTLYDQIVVGPTAKDQSSRTDDRIEPDVAAILASHASRVLGRSVDANEVAGEYVGIRPGTSKRDYQIYLHHKAKFITVGGIRSTGLTASLGIGRHVVQCLLPTIVSRPEVSCKKLLHSVPLPDVKELAEQYHRRNDGTVLIDGYSYKVTHPLTKFGWDARSGLAQS